MTRTIPARPWLVLALLTLFWGLVGLNRLGITFLFPIIVPAFHMTNTQASLLISGTSATWAISTWGSGFLSDRFGRRKVLLPGAFLAVGATAAMGGTFNFLSMFVVREVVGIGDGVGWPNAQAILGKEFPEKRRALVQSIFTAGYAFFGSVLGAIVITRLAKALGWQPVFPIIAAIFFFVVLALFFVMREPPRVEHAARPQWTSAFKLLRSRTVLLLMLVQAGALGFQQVGIGFNTLYLVRVRHVDIVAAGSIVALFGAASLVGTLVLPSVSDYIGRKPTLFLGGVLGAAFLLLYVEGGFSIGVTTAVLAASGFCWGVIIPLCAATCVVEALSEEIHATAMGAINFAGVVVGTFVIPIVAGVMADSFGLPATMMVAVGCVLVSGLAVLGIQESAPRVLARRGKQVQLVTV